MARYIDADALQERLQDFSDWCRDGRKQGVDFVLDYSLPNTPTADVQEVKHAKWITCGFFDDFVICSNCKKHKMPIFSLSDYIYNFCPYCGARMDGESECK